MLLNLSQILDKFSFREISKLSRISKLRHLDLKVDSSCLIKPCVKKTQYLDLTHSKCITVFILREKGLIWSYQEGLKRSYFQSPKERGHPVIILYFLYFLEGKSDLSRIFVVMVGVFRARSKADLGISKKGYAIEKCSLFPTVTARCRFRKLIQGHNIHPIFSLYHF